MIFRSIFFRYEETWSQRGIDQEDEAIKKVIFFF